MHRFSSPIPGNQSAAGPSLSGSLTQRPDGLPARARRRLAASFVTLVGIAASASACFVHATQLEVRVTGENLAPGSIGCALYSEEAGFPMDASKARMIWLPWQPGGVTCRFSDVAAGRHAVSVMNDQNGNGKVDTNFLGMPLEPWGVSNNARPLLRPPQFSEAAFQFSGVPLRIDVKIAQ